MVTGEGFSHPRRSYKGANTRGWKHKQVGLISLSIRRERESEDLPPPAPLVAGVLSAACTVISFHLFLLYLRLCRSAWETGPGGGALRLNEVRERASKWGGQSWVADRLAVLCSEVCLNF